MDRVKDLRGAHTNSPVARLDGMKNLDEFLDTHECIMLSTHTVPDGDGIGGEVALMHYLKKRGKQGYIINQDETPERLRFLDENKLIHTRSEYVQRGIPELDGVIILDGNDLSRIGSSKGIVDEKHLDLFYIDHHMGNDSLKNRYYVDEMASSIGEMLYCFLEWRGEVDLIDYPMAVGMYVSILTDTSSFRFSRTTAKSHLIAADLLTRGVDPERVYQNIYATNSIARMALLGEVLSNIHMDVDGTLAWIEITEHLQERYHTTAEEMEGFIDNIMLLKGVEVGAYFREDSDGWIKVSLRSRGNFHVHTVAMQFGGGGHKYSAGMMLKGDFRGQTDSVVAALRQILKESKS